MASTQKLTQQHSGGSPVEVSKTVVVSGDMPGDSLDLLRVTGLHVVAPGTAVGKAGADWTSAESMSSLRGADGLICTVRDRIDGELMAAAPRLQVIANVAVGTDNIDLDEARRRGIVVTNTPGVLTNATADLAIALLLGVTRRVAEGDRLIRTGRPWAWDLNFMLGTGLQGKTFGTVGYGAIGRATAARARAFGMDVIYTRSSPDPDSDDVEPGRVHWGELLERADVISLHCPLTPSTHHLVDRDALARMKPTTFLINTARGAVIDEQALVDALDTGVIAGAALDVFENEPSVHPSLRTRDNVVLLPHLGSATVETRAEMALLASRNVAAVLTGESPLTPVL